MTAAFDDIDAVVRAAESYMAAGDFRGAESVVGTALGAHPNHPRLLTVYARVKLGQSDYVAAASSAHAALSVAPENEYAMRIYSNALELQGRIPEALTMAWRTATAHPQSHLAHHTYARMLSDAGRPVEAMTAINEALRLNPNDADAFNLRGDIRVVLGEVDAAEADYRHALQLNPVDASVVHNLATLEYQRRRRWSAVRGFVVAERLDPRFGDVVRRNVGVVLTGVLRRSAWLVLIVTIAVVATYNMRDGGGATVIPRIVAGVGAVPPRHSSIFPLSGMCCCDSAVFNAGISSLKADNPVEKFFHCAAVRCIKDGLPVGHVMTAPANGPIPGIALSNPSISHHLDGGGTITPLGPVGASTAFVSLGSAPTEPMGPPPAMVDAASAFL
ncbi:MAG: hypothetical protein QOG19_1280 [Mycobacterium sp.]|nr:hypothetical protein [Mycobacterium sp.]